MDAAAETAVEASGLTKAFGATRAVDGIDLVIEQGTVHGFLGPNGAGKTTTLRMLATLLRPDTGTARVFGHDVVREAAAVRRRVSLTGQFASVDEDLTGDENLVLLAMLWGHSHRRAKSRAADLLDAFGLADAADRQVKTYSGGMQRRLDVAASLVVPPDLLFLDEPTTGLDPHSRNQVWDIVRDVVAQGTTVLLTTQYLEEADQFADRITVVDHGTVIAQGTTAELKASAGADTLRLRLRDPDRRPIAEQVLTRNLAATVQLGSDAATLAVPIPADAGDPADRHAVAALAELTAADVALAELTLGPPSLDEVFFALTGRNARPETVATEEIR